MKQSMKGNWYCSAKCWLPEEERNKPQSAPKPQNQAVSKHDVVINRTEKPHSFEFGPANMRHKVYYGDIAELKAHLKMLSDAELTEFKFDEQLISIEKH